MQLRLLGTGSGRDENESIDVDADNGALGGKCIIFEIFYLLLYLFYITILVIKLF